MGKGIYPLHELPHAEKQVSSGPYLGPKVAASLPAVDQDPLSLQPLHLMEDQTTQACTSSAW